MKKVLILAAVLIMCGAASGEDAKVFTDEDLKGYSKQPTSDPEKAHNDLKQWEQQKTIEEINKKAEADAERQRKLQESAVQAEWAKAQAEKEQAKAMEDRNREENTDRIFRYNGWRR